MVGVMRENMHTMNLRTFLYKLGIKEARIIRFTIKVNPQERLDFIDLQGVRLHHEDIR